MSVKLITADERLKIANTRTTILVCGEYSVGKTSLLYTLDAATTLALDFEGGFKSVQTWTGDSIHIRDYQDAVDLACYIGGADPAVGNPYDNYSADHYAYCVSMYGFPKGSVQPIDLKKYKLIWFDSLSDLTVAARVKARSRNIMYDKKTGQPMREANGEIMIDTRGMYGDIANDVMSLVRHMQHHENVNVVWVCKLEEAIDEYKRKSWQLLLEGQKIRKELPFAVDQVVTMGFFDWNDKAGWTHAPGGAGAERVFVCRRTNPWGLPAKERTQGNLDIVEPPNLGALIAKINGKAHAAAS